MSHRIEDKERRRQARLAAEAALARTERRHHRRNLGFWTLAGALVVGLLVAAFALPARNTTTSTASGASAGSGPVASGSRAPDFRVTDVVSGKALSLVDLRGRRTLLFFSEGASCQACLVQAAELQKSKAFKRAEIGLVSITTDTPDILSEVAAQYDITTPLLADENLTMSTAYGQLGRGGMGHAETDGHSFVLLDGKSRVTWERAYQEMYVPTPRLLADMGV